MFVDTSLSNMHSRQQPALPEMAKPSCPSIHHVTFHSPPLTPTTDPIGLKYENGFGRRSSAEENCITSLVNLCHSAIGRLGPSTGYYTPRSSISGTGRLPHSQAENQLPPISKQPRQDQAGKRLPSIANILNDLPPEYPRPRENLNRGAFSQPFSTYHRNSSLPTPLPSPTCSSNGSFAIPPVNYEVPWSRAELPENTFAQYPNSRPSPLSERHAISQPYFDRQIRQQQPASPSEGIHKTKDGRVKKSKPKKGKGGNVKSSCHDNQAQKKRGNEKYLPEQEYFTVYHKNDLNMQWKKVEECYNEAFPHKPRSESGLQCQYYLGSSKIPELNADGFLVLRYDFSKEEDEAKIVYQMPGRKRKILEKYCTDGSDGIPRVEYPRHPSLVREKEVPLLQRFPEVLANEKYHWVRPEHREQAKILAAARIKQREEWREWMQQHHPERLHEIDNPKSKSKK